MSAHGGSSGSARSAARRAPVDRPSVRVLEATFLQFDCTLGYEGEGPSASGEPVIWQALRRVRSEVGARAPPPVPVPAVLLDLRRQLAERVASAEAAVAAAAGTGREADADVWHDALEEPLFPGDPVDADTQQAMKWMYQTHGLRTEPSGAIALAALLTGRAQVEGEGDIVVVVSGRNVDEEQFGDWITC